MFLCEHEMYLYQEIRLRSCKVLSMFTFLCKLFFAPDQFDDFRSGVREMAGGAFTYASESLTTLSEKSEAITN